MKKLNNPQVGHSWAHQTYSAAQGSNFSHTGKVAFSYTTVIGQIITDKKGEQIAVLCSERYSATTSSKHMPQLSRAIYGVMPVYSSPLGGGGELSNAQIVRAANDKIIQLAKSFKEKFKPSASSSNYVYGQINSLIELVTRLDSCNISRIDETNAKQWRDNILRAEIINENEKTLENNYSLKSHMTSPRYYADAIAQIKKAIATLEKMGGKVAPKYSKFLRGLIKGEPQFVINYMITSARQSIANIDNTLSKVNKIGEVQYWAISHIDNSLENLKIAENSVTKHGGDLSLFTAFKESQVMVDVNAVKARHNQSVIDRHEFTITDSLGIIKTLLAENKKIGRPIALAIKREATSGLNAYGNICNRLQATQFGDIKTKTLTFEQVQSLKTALELSEAKINKLELVEKIKLARAEITRVASESNTLFNFNFVKDLIAFFNSKESYAKWRGLPQLVAIRDRLIKQQHDAIAEKLAKWRNCESSLGAIGYTDYIYLRLNSDNGLVETSRSASIPVSQCERIWRLVNIAIKRGENIDVKETNEVSRIGHYHLDTVFCDGSIKAGCHTIAFAELQLIASQLGYLVADNEN